MQHSKIRVLFAVDFTLLVGSSTLEITLQKEFFGPFLSFFCPDAKKKQLQTNEFFLFVFDKNISL